MMQITNTKNRFGIMAMQHWLMAILLSGLLALGLYRTGIPISRSL